MALFNLKDYLSQLGLVNSSAQFKADVTANANIDAKQIDSSKKIQKTLTYNPVVTTSSQYAPVDARSLVLTLNSPYAQPSNKNSVYGATAAQRVDTSATSDPTFSAAGQSGTPTFSLAGLAPNLSGFSNWLVIGGLALAGFGIYKVITHKKAK